MAASFHLGMLLPLAAALMLLGLLFKHWAPGFMSNYRIVIGSINITEVIVLLIVFLVVLVVSILIGLLFAATSIRLKGAYFAMLTLALAPPFTFSVRQRLSQMDWRGRRSHHAPLPLWLNPTQNRLTVYLLPWRSWCFLTWL